MYNLFTKIKICLVCLIFIPFYPLVLLQKSYTNTPLERWYQEKMNVHMYASKLQSESQIHRQLAKKFVSSTHCDVHGNRILYWPPRRHNTSDSFKSAATEPENVKTIIYKVKPMKQKCVCLDNETALTVYILRWRDTEACCRHPRGKEMAHDHVRMW